MKIKNWPRFVFSGKCVDNRANLLQCRQRPKRLSRKCLNFWWGIRWVFVDNQFGMRWRGQDIRSHFYHNKRLVCGVPIVLMCPSRNIEAKHLTTTNKIYETSILSNFQQQKKHEFRIKNRHLRLVALYPRTNGIALFRSKDYAECVQRPLSPRVYW